MLFIATAAVTLVLALVFTPERKTITVPIEFCRSTPTGREHTYDMANTTCASFDKNGVCMLPITTYTQQTNLEFRVACEFTEWRTQ